MSSENGSSVIFPRDCETDCIVMYGGGLTSYEAAKRSIDKYGRESVEIWFADTRMEDEDLYRFNRDVEILLQHEIIVFDGIIIAEGSWESNNSFR